MKQAIGTCTWPVALAARRGTWTADAGPASHEAVAHSKTPDVSTNSARRSHATFWLMRQGVGGRNAHPVWTCACQYQKAGDFLLSSASEEEPMPGFHALIGGNPWLETQHGRCW